MWASLNVLVSFWMYLCFIECICGSFGCICGSFGCVCKSFGCVCGSLLVLVSFWMYLCVSNVLVQLFLLYVYGSCTYTFVLQFVFVLVENLAGKSDGGSSGITGKLGNRTISFRDRWWITPTTRKMRVRIDTDNVAKSTTRPLFYSFSAIHLSIHPLESIRT